MASRAGGLVGRVRRWAGGFLPGAVERRQQTDDYLSAWTADNDAASQESGPLWVVLGDSTAQGIGTSSRDHGYALTALRALRAQRDPRWRVINVSRSGARVRDVLTEQLASRRGQGRSRHVRRRSQRLGADTAVSSGLYLHQPRRARPSRCAGGVSRATLHAISPDQGTGHPLRPVSTTFQRGRHRCRCFTARDHVS